MARRCCCVMMSLGLLFVVGHSLEDALPHAPADEVSSAETNAARDEQDAQLPMAWVDPSAAEKKIVEALQSRVTLDFQNAPLQDVVDYAEKVVDIQIHCDASAMENVSLGPELAAVTIQLKNVRLQGALEMMLEPLDLAWTVRHEVLTITSKERAESRLSTKVYDVTDLVLYRDASGRLNVDFESLMHTMTLSVSPATWNEVGGAGTIAPVVAGQAHLLVIGQTFPLHLKIAEVLTRLRKAAREHPDDALPPVRPGMPWGVPGFGMGGQASSGGGFGGVTKHSR